MLRAIAILILATGLAGCNVITALVDGAKHAKAVETDLEQATGIKPDVGFNWKNGELRVVTVTFPRLYEERPIGELAGAVRAAVKKEFQETPDRIVLAFSLSGTAPGRAAQIEQKRPRGGFQNVNFEPSLTPNPH
ncbi:MAG: hypothetical protein ABSC72_05080 [Methylovirgula sp.]|jgi:hypothetical protein